MLRRMAAPYPSGFGGQVYRILDKRTVGAHGGRPVPDVVVVCLGDHAGLPHRIIVLLFCGGRMPSAPTGFRVGDRYPLRENRAVGACAIHVSRFASMYFLAAS